MRDNQEIMTKFVKIVERFAEVYDRSLESYRTRHADKVWDKIAEVVKSEIREDCTAEELKAKWKGLRSSYTRYKNKLHDVGHKPCKAYYLYETLHFLEPHILTRASDKSDISHEEEAAFVDVNESQSSSDYNAIDGWRYLEIKPDIVKSETFIEPSTPDEIADDTNIRKRKFSEEKFEEDNEDMLFFKSILPDIKGFTVKQKRKLKMGILQLIDDVENQID